MNVHEPDIDRLISAFNLEEPDWVPHWEPHIHGRAIEYILGRRVTFRPLDICDELELSSTVTNEKTIKSKPNYSEEEWLIRFNMGGINWRLRPSDYIEFCRKTRTDVMTINISKRAAGRFLEESLERNSKRFEGKALATTLEESIINDWEDLDKLEFGTIDAQIKFLEDLVEAKRGTKIGVAGMTRSVLCNTYSVMGIANFSRKLYTDRKLVEAVMDIFLANSIEITESISRFDIDFFYLDDDIADSHGPLISQKLLRELWLPRTEEMLKPVKRKEILIAWHCCGNLKQVIPLAVELGINAINPIQSSCNDIEELKKMYGDEICLVGGIDIGWPLSFGTPKDVMKVVKSYIEKIAPGGGYVAASSHSIINSIPPENYKAMVEAVHTYGKYPIRP